MPEIVETSQQTVIASEGTPTAQYGRQQLMCFPEIRQKEFRVVKNS
jgi:hypothetical protein